jgi:hypothetical protein
MREDLGDNEQASSMGGFAGCAVHQAEFDPLLPIEPSAVQRQVANVDSSRLLAGKSSAGAAVQEQARQRLQWVSQRSQARQPDRTAAFWLPISRLPTNCGPWQVWPRQKLSSLKADLRVRIE